MKLFELLTSEELKRIRKHELIRNSEIKDLTIEELQVMPLDSITDENNIITHAAYVLDELLMRQHMRTKPMFSESLPSNLDSNGK